MMKGHCIEILPLALGLALSVPTLAQAVTSAPIYSIDFGRADHSVSNQTVGSFAGVLPSCMGDNFTPWKAVHATSELIQDVNGRSVLRIENCSSEPAQFMCLGCRKVLSPGIYRIVLRARTLGCGLEYGFRDAGKPYATHWKGLLDSPEWQECEVIARLEGQGSGTLAFMLYPGSGITELDFLKVFVLSESECADRIRRPDEGTRFLARSHAFPFGLPVGWNVGTHGAVPDRIVSEAGKLLVASSQEAEIYTSPFGIIHPDKVHTLELSGVAMGTWRLEVRKDRDRWHPLSSRTISSNGVFKLEFRPPRDAAAFCGRIVGSGRLLLNSFLVYEGVTTPARDEEELLEVELAAGGGDIAADTRINFVDETPNFRWQVKGSALGDRLVYRVSDVYGNEVHGAQKDASSGAGLAEYLGKRMDECGAFLVEAWLERKSKRISPIAELQIIRIARPVYWGEDAPDSPFGGHFLPRLATVRTMKAIGVNWVRLHDAGIELSGWCNLERVRGRWTFQDDAIAVYRKAKVKILAQLGTAPAWATHYGDLGFRQMGYFERYLRPTNTVDFLNYVTRFAQRYHREVDQYFLWNEPWGRWWKYASDANFFKSESAGAAFGRLQREVYAALKLANPTATLCGYNSIAGFDGWKWTQDVDQPGVFESCDAIDYHFYADCSSLRMEGEPLSSEMPLRILRARHKAMKDKRVYMTEGNCVQTGWMSGLYRHLVPYRPETPVETAQIADRLCRYVIGLLRERVDRIFLYSSHTYSSFAAMPTFPAMLGGDGYAHPSAAAFSHLARQLEGLRYEKTEKQCSRGLAYSFVGKRGRCVVYANLSAEEAVALSRCCDLSDLWGNRFDVSRYVPYTLLYARLDMERR